MATELRGVKSIAMGQREAVAGAEMTELLKAIAQRPAPFGVIAHPVHSILRKSSPLEMAAIRLDNAAIAAELASIEAMQAARNEIGALSKYEQQQSAKVLLSQVVRQIS